MKNILIIICALFVITSAFAQDCKIWNDFVQSKKQGTTPPLPDFSYAGYQFSEEPIPTVKNKVFDVTKFGAKPNDNKSDKTAIKKAIAAAEKNGKGIVFFPKGKYLINTPEDDNSIIEIKSSNIVLRGEGSGDEGSVLFFDRDLPATDPNKMWTCPYAIKVSTSKNEKVLANITGKAARETFTLELDNASKIKAGEWVILKMQSNAPETLEYDLSPCKADPKWTAILEEGVLVKEIHLVDNVEGNKVTFYDPIHYDVNPKHGWTINKFEHLENIGFEDMAFEGNWLIPFKHHANAQHDGGWSILHLSQVVNSWVKDCRFKNVSRCVSFSSAAACTALNNVIEGNLGHNAITIGNASTGVLNAKTIDRAGMWHACGVGNNNITRNVIWRCKHTPTTCFESHASQIRCTLFDNIEGGFFLGRAGGARQNLPNHGRYLVLWNYKETDAAEDNFEFWSSKTWYWKVVPPIVVGFQGGTTFKKDQIAYEESNGVAVQPESLFEEQLKLRLGKLPEWINEMK